MGKIEISMKCRLFFVLLIFFCGGVSSSVNAQNEAIIILEGSIGNSCDGYGSHDDYVLVKKNSLEGAFIYLEFAPKPNTIRIPIDEFKAGYYIYVDRLVSVYKESFPDYIYVYNYKFGFRSEYFYSDEVPNPRYNGIDVMDDPTCTFGGYVVFNILVPFKITPSLLGNSVADAITLTATEPGDLSVAAETSGIKVDWEYRVGMSGSWIPVSYTNKSYSGSQTSITFLPEANPGFSNLTAATNVSFRVKASYGGYAVYSNIEDFSFKPAAPTINGSITTKESCTSSPTGTITIPSVKAAGEKVRWMLKDGIGVVNRSEDFIATNGCVITGVAPGSYILMLANIGDEEGAGNTSYPVTVDTLQVLALDSSSVSDASCAQIADGKASLSFQPTGAAPTADSVTVEKQVGSTMEKISNPIIAINGYKLEVSDLAVGSYKVTVGGACGSTVEQDFNVGSILSPLSIKVDPHTLPSCSTVADGVITLTVNNQNKSVTVCAYFNGSSTPVKQTRQQDTFTFSGCKEGTYRFTAAFSDNGLSACSTTESSNLSFAASPVSFAATPFTTTNLSCYGDSNGMVEVHAGSPGSYRYILDGGDGDVYENTNGKFNDLKAKQYTAFIKRLGATCTDEISGTVEIFQPTQLVPTADASPVKCYGENSGSVKISVAGGTAPYQSLYVKKESLPEFEQVDFGVDSTAIQKKHLSSGTYSYYVTDSNSCKTGEQTFTITEPTELQFIESSCIFPDVACKGGTSPVSLVAEGGTGTYTFYQSSDNGFSWSEYPANGSLPAGSYAFKVVDGNSCKQEYSLENVTISEPYSALTLNADPTIQGGFSGLHLRCFGATDGKVELEANDGWDASYTYACGSGSYQASPIFEGLGSGEHTFRVKDAKGCEVSASATLVEPEQLALQAAITHPECAENPYGSVAITAGQGGVGGYTFSMDELDWGETEFGSLPVGSHRFYVRDANSCQRDTTLTLSYSTDLTLQVTYKRDVDCAVAGSGIVELAASGGAGSYSYKHYDLTRGLESSLQNSTGTYSGLQAGEYAFEVVDASGCVMRTTATIGITNNLAVAKQSLTHTQCFASANGEVVLQGSGGSGAYVFSRDGDSWQSDPLFGGLTAGTYPFFVKDSNECTSSVSYEIENVGTLALTTSGVVPVDCADATSGVVTLSATGGMGGNTYYYGTELADGQASPVFGSLPYGTHQFMVADSYKCTAFASAFIDNTDNLTLTVASYSDPECREHTSGVVNLSAGGGSGVYTYRIAGQSEQSGGTFLGLNVGSHTFEVTDSNGCSRSVEQALAYTTTISLSVLSRQDVDCAESFSGSVTLSGSGGAVGVESYSYSYGDAGTGWTANPLFGNLQVGTHSFRVKDASGCTAGVSATIQNTSSLAVSVSLVSGAECVEKPNGKAELTAVGGSGTYSYSTDHASWQVATLFEDLPAGDNRFYVRDANGCVSFVDYTIPTTTDLALSIANVHPVDCQQAQSGVVQLYATGGAGTYTYSYGESGSQWNADPEFGMLGMGLHRFRVKDASGCTASAEASVANTDNLRLSVAHFTDTECFESANGEVVLAVSGGSGSYTYRLGSSPWQPEGHFSRLTAGSYRFQVKDSNGCERFTEQELVNSTTLSLSVAQVLDASCRQATNGVVTLSATGGSGSYTYRYEEDSSSWQESALFSSLPVGKHAFWVQDASKCKATVSVSVGESNTLALGIIAEAHLACPESRIGSISVQGESGVAPYRYRINGGAWQASPTFSGLGVSSYTLEVVDEVGCMAAKATQLEASLAPLALQATVTDVGCYGEPTGSIFATASGGTLPYSYSWDGKAGSNRLDNIPSGTYRLVATDAGGCSVSSSWQVGQPLAALSATASSVPVCPGSQGGEITIYPVGGTTPYTYLVNNRSYASGTIGQLAAGTYTVQVHDARQCTVELSQHITTNTLSPNVNFLLASKHNASDTLVAKEISVPQADSLRWEFDRRITVVSGGSEPVVTFSEDGVYTVKLVGYYGGCPFSVVKEVSIHPDNPKNPSRGAQGIKSLVAYPNPHAGVFTIRVELQSKQQLRIQLYDLSGKLYLNKLAEAEVYEEYISLPELPRGVYILRAITASEEKQQKLIRQ